MLIHGEREAIATLVRNLVDNAVRYTPGGGRVDVTVLDSGEPGRAVLKVTDNGPGIPPEERARVFDRFYRQPGANAPGSGLGLAIVKTIAVAHRAQVELGAGDDGRGLTVTVTFAAAPPA